MAIKLTVFPAENGESILVEIYGKRKINILVDLGYSDTYTEFIKRKLELLSQNHEKIDLLVLTHFDRDHIEGCIEFFSDLLKDKFIDIEEIWINDFLALAYQNYEMDDIGDTQKLIYDFSDFMMKEYRIGNSDKIKQTISIDESITITKLINLLGFDKKVNKSFKDKIVWLENEEKDNLVSLNSEVSLKILAPEKDTLKMLLFRFLDWFEKNRSICSYMDKKELFELFIANLDDNIKDLASEVLLREKTTSNSGCKEKIDSILKNNDIFKDKSLTNNSSIAFILKFNDINIMFTGDLDCKNIIDTIEGEKVDLLKLPHHGSKNNTNIKFINSIQCNNYLICTDGSGRSKHPDLETLVYVAQKRDSNVCINYPINEFSIDQDFIEELSNEYNMNLITTTGNDQSYLEIILDKGEELIWQEVSF